MGLDMYLERHHYVKQWDHTPPADRYTVATTKGGEPTTIKPERVTYIVEQVAQWRKANEIHRWFVEAVQEGEDDCRDYYVSRDQLAELIGLAQQVIAEPGKALELLPTESGFFFGGTEYDDDYFDDLKRTVEMLTAILAEPEEGEFRYRASW